MRKLLGLGSMLTAMVVALAFAGAGSKAFTPVKVEMETTTTLKQSAGKAQPGMPSGPMKMAMTMWLKSEKLSRTEMSMPMMPGGKQVVIVKGDTMFIVNDTQKSVQKMSMASATAMAGSMGLGGMSSMSSSPAPDPKSLEKLGLKKSGTETVGKDACNVYKGKVGQGQLAMDVTMWLRQSDGFVVKSEGSNAMLESKSELKRVEKNPSMPDSLFAVPADYKVQDLAEVFAKAKGRAQGAACMSNMKQVALAIHMYAADHKNQLPDYRKLEQELKPYLKNTEVLRCNAAKGKLPHYKMNSKCQGDQKALADAAGTILLFECDAKGRPEHRHSGTINLAYLDGHVKATASGQVKPGMWTPTAGD